MLLVDDRSNAACAPCKPARMAAPARMVFTEDMLYSRIVGSKNRDVLLKEWSA